MNGETFAVSSNFISLLLVLISPLLFFTSLLFFLMSPLLLLMSPLLLLMSTLIFLGSEMVDWFMEGSLGKTSLLKLRDIFDCDLDLTKTSGFTSLNLISTIPLSKTFSFDSELLCKMDRD